MRRRVLIVKSVVSGDEDRFDTGNRKRGKRAQSWLRSSGQAWKMYVFAVMVFLDLALFILFIVMVNHPEMAPGIADGKNQVLCGFAVLGVGTFGWLFYSIRCPHCRRGVAWAIVKVAGVNDWLTRIFSLRECPRCRMGLR